jgi:hypothetical protein
MKRLENAYSQNLTEEEFSSSQRYSGRNRTPEELEQTEAAGGKEAGIVSRIMGGEEMARFQAAGFDARSYLGFQTDTLPAESLLPHPREPSQLRDGGRILGMERDAHFEPDFG